MGLANRSPANKNNPEEITIESLAKELKELVGSGVNLSYHPLPSDDPKKRKPDISKAIEILGWQPKISRKEGIIKTIEWFKKSQSNLKFSIQ